MPAPPVKPLLDIGDALNQFAPHNVLNALLSGGQAITITPVLGRQPTLYEEMTRVPVRRAAAVPEGNGLQALGDALLEFTPHNALLALLGGGQFGLPAGVSMPSGMMAPKPGETLQSLGATLGGEAGWRNEGAGLYHTNDTVTVKAPANRKIAVAVRPMKNVRTFNWGDEVYAFGFRKKDKGTVLDFSPQPVPDTPPTVDIIDKGQTKPYKLSKDHTYDYKTLGKDWYNLDFGTATDTDHDLYIDFIGIEPEAPTPPVPPTPPVTPPPAPPTAPPTAEDIEALRQQYLGEIDGWITEASGKIGIMNNTDIPMAEGYAADVQKAFSTLSSANQSGQVPAFPLFAGGFLSLFEGGALPPLPFPLFGGGQVGAAASQVSSLMYLSNNATSVKGQLDDDARSARTASANLESYRGDVATATDRTSVVTAHANAQREYNTVISKTSSVSSKANTLQGYSTSAKTAYSQGINAIQAVPKAPPPPVKNIFYKGTWYTHEDLMKKAGETTDIAEAINIYDTLGETGEASRLRTQVSGAEAAAKAARATANEAWLQAIRLESQGNYRDAAVWYEKAGRPDMAEKARGKVATQEAAEAKKAAAKSKAAEIAAAAMEARRKAAAAKAAAAKKTKVM